jgi:DNA repair protein RecO (recombination protein O)
MINGIYGPKAAIKPSLLQPLSMLEMVVYNNPVKNIQRIKEAKSQPPLQNLHFDVVKGAIGMFMAELIYRTVKEEEPNENLYDFLENIILTIDASDESLALWPLYFTLHFTQWLGFFPHNNWSEENTYFSIEEGSFTPHMQSQALFIESPHSEYLSRVLSTNINTLPTLDIPKASRTYLLDRMMDYYKVHLSDFSTLKSLSVLSSLMKD